jgi:hypothetical protein
MNECNGNTGWSTVSSSLQIISILALTFVFTKSIYESYKNRDQEEYENLDILLVGLSMVQIYIMIMAFIFGKYFGFFVFYEIFKLSQNTAIAGCLLFQLLLALNYSITFNIVKLYFLMIVVFDVLVIFASFSAAHSFFDLNFQDAYVLWVLPIIGILVDLSIIGYTVYLDCSDTNSDTEGSLNKDNYNLNQIIRKYTSSIKKMKKYYFVIIIAFAISYFIDLCFKTLINSNCIMTKEEINSYSSVYNNTNSDYTNSYSIASNNTDTLCINNYFGDNYGFKEFIICLISFYFRDLGPHAYLYFALFYFKTKNTSRSSSFIELI